MKKAIFSLILFLAIGTWSSAQRLGVKAGGNFTNVIGSNATSSGSTSTDKHSYIPGFHVGVFGQVDLGSVVSLQAEAVFSKKGFRQKSSTTSGVSGGSTIVLDMNVKNSYSYVDVPLLLNIHFGEMSSYIGFGPQLSFLVGYKQYGTKTITTTTSTSSTSNDVTISNTDKTGLSTTDLGVVIGTGSKWDSGIEYCIRAGYGITNLVASASTPSGYTPASWHHLVFSVSIGYSFGAGGGGGGDRYGHKYNKKTKHR